MASAEIIALDSEGDDPAQFGMVGWQAPNAAGASAFQAIDLGSDTSDDEPFAASPEVRQATLSESAPSGKGAADNVLGNIEKASNAAGGGGASNGLIEAGRSENIHDPGAVTETNGEGSYRDASADGPERGDAPDAWADNGGASAADATAGEHQAASVNVDENDEREKSNDNGRAVEDEQQVDEEQQEVGVEEGRNGSRVGGARGEDGEQLGGPAELSHCPTEAAARGGAEAISARQQELGRVAVSEQELQTRASGTVLAAPEGEAHGAGQGMAGVEPLPTAPPVDDASQEDAPVARDVAEDVEVDDVGASSGGIVDAADVNVAVDTEREAVASSLEASSGANNQSTSQAESAAESMESIIDALPPGFVGCPGCPMVYELVPNEDAARGGGGGVAAKELPKGANLSRRAAMRHNGRHRFRCPACATCFCGSCRATPYHIGFDCEGWTAYQAKPKCTYCGDAAEEPGEWNSVDGEVGLAVPPCCGGEECRERAHEGCRKKLACGHPCRGPGGGDCLPCIEPGCPSAELDGDAEYCNVCWTESLLAAPCVKLECGHFVHVSCGREQLQRGRPTARLTFGFMSCPVCRAEKALATHPHLAKGEGIAEQLTLAHEVEELALHRLRADELPPLQRSPMESLQAKMRRRMAGLARHRQLDGNPANWRARGRGGPFPLHMPYPPAHPAYNLPRRMRPAGRLPPMLPEPLSGGPGEWQPFVALGADWGMPPFVPLMPPPYLPNNGAGGARPAGAMGGPGPAAGGAGGGRPSWEAYLERQRAMVVAQADISMINAAGGGAPRAPPEAVPRAQDGGEAGSHPVGPGRSHAARERIEKRLEKGRAMLEERRRARREARQALEDLVMEDDWSLPDGFPYRSKRPRRVRKVPPMAGAGADANSGGSGQDAKEQRLPASGDEWAFVDAPRRGADLDDPAGWPAALHLRLDPPLSGREVGGYRQGVQGAGARRRREIVEEPPEDNSDELEGHVEVGGSDDKKGVGVWGWGVAGRWWGGGGGRQPSDDSQPDGRGQKRCSGEVAEKLCHEQRKEAVKIEGVGGLQGEAGAGMEQVDGKLAAAAASLEAPAQASRAGLQHGNDDAAGKRSWFDVPLSSLSAMAATAPSEKAAAGSAGAVEGGAAADEKNEDDEVVVLEDEGNSNDSASAAAVSSPAAKRKAMQGVGDGSPPVPGVAPKLRTDDDVSADDGFAGGAGKEGGLERSAEGAGEIEAESEVVEIAADHSKLKSKKVHFAAGFKRARRSNPDGLGVGNARNPWLPVDGGGRGGAAYFERGKEEKRAAGAIAGAMVAAAKMAAEDKPLGRPLKIFPQGYSRGGKVGLAAAAMLRLHVAPSARRQGGRAGEGSEAGAADAGASPGASNSALPAWASNAPAAPKIDGSEEVKKAESAAAPPPAVQTKEERTEMVKRALKKYSFYQCHSCRKPYFGGLVSCEPAAPAGGGGAGAGAGGALAGGAGDGEAGEAAAAERALADVKPQELLCGKCSAGSGGADCSEHGQEFMEHKCYWCCRKVASYFCGGAMHFCDVCHLHGFAAKPKPCLGGARCLFGGAHPPRARNGDDEFVLGCGICRPKPEEADGAAAGQ